MAEERYERRLAAILATDMVGYSRAMGANEAATVTRLKALQSELFEPATARHGGRIFKTTGDGALVEFASAVDAVTCALGIQRALAARNAALPDDQRIALRIGVSLGDVIVDSGDLYGNGVNVAARMEGLAEPGGICVSGNVFEHVGTAVEARFDDLGEQTVKNIDQPVRCYRVVAESPAPAVSPPVAAARRPAIAVLPFDNLSGDPEQGYFADGMVEEIITGLSRIRSLTVIARNSSFAFRGQPIDIRDIARKLDVRYVLEGSVRKSGERVRITAQLIEAEGGGHIWADRFDGTLADVFDLQDQITAGVVAAIEPNVRKAEIERAKRKRPDNLDAYDLYLRALEQSYTFTSAGQEAALSLLEAALELDPDYTQAHGVAAFCLQQRFMWGRRVPADREAGLKHAEAVAAAQTDDASTLAFAAFALSALAGNHAAALAMVKRALMHTPSSAAAYTVSALVNMSLGRYDTSQSHAEQALRLSPFDPFRYTAEAAIAIAKLVLGRHEDALASARRALEANSGFGPALVIAVLCLVRLDQHDEARAAARRLHEVAPDMRAGTLRRLLFSDALGHDTIVADLRAAGLPE